MSRRAAHRPPWIVHCGVVCSLETASALAIPWSIQVSRSASDANPSGATVIQPLIGRVVKSMIRAPGRATNRP